MKIAHVIDSMEVGGAEMVVASLCRLQAAAGQEVSVHCLFTGGRLADELANEGISIFVYGPGRIRTLSWHLYRRFRGVRPDVVHCHNKTATVHAAPAARAAGTRAILSTRHGMASPPYRLRKDFKYWLCAAMFCNRVVAVCDVARRNMHQNAGALARHVVTIRNGAYPAEESAAAPIETEGRFVLVTVGRLVPAKNYPDLLRAIAAALPSVPDLKLWIVGDGDERTALHALVKELGISAAVQFFGEQRAVGNWLNRADAFVLSSISEGLPVSILEAMAAGLPTIVTNVGGMPEVLELSGAGTLVPPGNIDLLSQAIVAFASRRDDLKELRHRARSCYLQHFRPERMAEDYLTLYRTFLSRVQAGV